MFYKCCFTIVAFLFLCLLFVKYRVHGDAHDSSLSSVIDLVESTHIIRQLIKENALEKVLEEHDPEQLSLLLDNVSPAAMAFESEVLTTTIPLVVVCYYTQDDEEHELLVQQLESLAGTYADEVKFVIVDIERLFSLAQDAQIEKTPTILIVKDREIIDRFEGSDSINFFERTLGSVR